MRFFLSIVLSLQVLLSNAQFDDLRNLYFQARSSEGITTFYLRAQDSRGSDPLTMAYKGVATAMYAEVAGEVSEKLDYFNRGKQMLESAVNSDWYNAEIRFLRFSVQAEAPFFLGYRGKLEEDAYVIIDAFEKKYIDPKTDFWRKALTFLKDSDELNADQENRLKKILLT